MSDIGEVLEKYGMDPFALQNIVRAYETVQDCEVSYEDARDALEDAWKLQSWLYAERKHWAEVGRWLEAESKWKLTSHLIANNPTYAAAERGWLRMRELCPNLDGVREFSQLAPPLQARYALFAEAVLDR